MKKNSIITPYEFSNFLKNGSIFRSGDEWFLLNSLLATSAAKENIEISIGCATYMGGAESLQFYRPHQYWHLSTENFRHLLLSNLKDMPYSLKNQWIEPSFGEFSADFKKIKDQLNHSHLMKAVPIVFSKSAWVPTDGDLIQMLLSLTSAPSNLHVYGFWNSQEGMLGATPEILFQIDGDQLRSMALAGTLPRQNQSQPSELFQNQKEMTEHAFVKDDLQFKLSKWGDVWTSPTTVLELPGLFHLCTDFSISNSNHWNLYELIKELHPTPALGPYPRNDFWNWHKTLNNQTNRNYFGAPWIFQKNKQQYTCLVAIRNIQWNSSGTRIGSGCGIVKESQLDLEWEELFQKRRSVMKLLGITNDLASHERYHLSK